MYQYSPCHCDLFSCGNTMVCSNIDEQCMMINDDALSDFYHVYRRTKTWSGHSFHKTETKQFFKKQDNHNYNNMYANTIHLIFVFTCLYTLFWSCLFCILNFNNCMISLYFSPSTLLPESRFLINAGA